jgi:hypothetical protein
MVCSCAESNWSVAQRQPSRRRNCLSPLRSSATNKPWLVARALAQLVRLVVLMVALEAVQLARLHAHDAGPHHAVAQRVVHAPVLPPS